MDPETASSTAALDQLARRAQGGDREAFQRLVIAAHRDVRRVLAGFQVAEGMAEEVLQGTFVKAWERLGSYRPDGTFLPWIKAIARNLLLNELRAHKRMVAAQGDAIEEAIVDDALAEAERAEESSVRLARLGTCLERLNEQGRALVEARYLRGESLGSIAARCRQSEGWVRVTLFRVRRLLRGCMQEAEAA